MYQLLFLDYNTSIAVHVLNPILKKNSFERTVNLNGSKSIKTILVLFNIYIRS